MRISPAVLNQETAAEDNTPAEVSSVKLKYMGKFDGDPASLPCREHRPGAVKFREFDDMKKFAVWMNIAAMVIMAVLAAFVFLRVGARRLLSSPGFLPACLLPMAAMFPHELLHGVCFREDAYLYTNFRQGMLFVCGPEDFSRGRFVFMSLLPNLVFGFLPYAVGLIFPSLPLKIARASAEARLPRQAARRFQGGNSVFPP
jgi:hypothetical protein